jgi:hypothetical protein
VTPAEIRAWILRSTETIAETKIVLEIIREERQEDREQREKDRKAIRDLEKRQATQETRLALMERDAEIRAKREAELRTFRLGFWIAVFSAVASFVGSLVVAYYSSRIKR